jgi:hypothetical protein
MFAQSRQCAYIAGHALHVAAPTGRDNMQHAAQATVTIPAGIYNGVECVEMSAQVIGVLTTEHSASSYGMPVFVAYSLNGDRFAGRVIDPAEADSVSLTVECDDLETADDPARLIAAAKRAGYKL